MKFTATTATKKISALDKRLRAVAGGTSASKTISILMWLIDYAQTHPNELISVVSETYPHLKKGSMLDFENIMKAQGYWNDTRWNKTDHVYEFETGAKIEFFSADATSKVHGPRRDVLFVNEANNIPYPIYDQMKIRTKKIIWLDWNPTHEFWYYTDVKDNIDHDFIILTYLDNEALEPAIIEDIESHKHNKNWWNVYGLGLLGETEGKIYKDWKIINEIPHEARLEVRGLDFGYSRDPAVLVDIYRYNSGYILDEVFNQVGMKNRQIADHIKNLEDPQTLVIADSAEPKSIDEIAEWGINIIGANKGKGSVNQGINWVQDQRVSMTSRSLGLIKAYRNYMWETDKDGNILNKPSHDYSDPMDATRYGMEYFKPKIREEDEHITTGDFAGDWS